MLCRTSERLFHVQSGEFKVERVHEFASFERVIELFLEHLGIKLQQLLRCAGTAFAGRRATAGEDRHRQFTSTVPNDRFKICGHVNPFGITICVLSL